MFGGLVMKYILILILIYILGSWNRLMKQMWKGNLTIIKLT